MAEVGSARKLASIVAIDVAGYSRRTEADEEAAIQAVATLKVSVSKAAHARGGRVFNTAGDGFMLEFPSASSALAAAEEIARTGETPVRVGVHLGDVSLTEDGDLLGHGVNVAARIQQMAQPGAVLVSGDVKRAIRGPLGARLKPQGSVRLDKMSEVIPVFALAPAEGGRAKGRRLDLKGPLALATVAMLVVIIGLVAWFGRDAIRPAAHVRVAVPPFQVLGTDANQRVTAEGMRDQILSVMSANQVSTVSRSDSEALRGPDPTLALKQLGVTLLLDGSIEEEGHSLDVRIHLDDPRQHVTLWTTSFQGPADQAGDLQNQVSAEVTEVLLCANGLQRSRSAPTDTDTIALFFRACDLTQNIWSGAQRTEQTLDVLRQLTARAPGFAPGHSRIAYVQAARYRYRDTEPGDAPSFFKEASAEAHRALQIDADDGDAWLALSLLQPVTAYGEREKLLVRGLKEAPTHALLLRRYAELLAEVGRMQDAAVYAARATASAPLSHEEAGAKAVLEASAGAFPAARADAAENLRTWPSAPDAWTNAAFVAIWASDWTQAEALLKQPTLATAPQAVEFLRTCVGALRSREPAKVAIAERDVRAIAVAAGQPGLHWAIQCMAQLGLMDTAFDMSRQYRPDAYAYEGPAIFFYPSTAGMRRDRRFMALAAKLGLIAYWRSTGKWPDFCSEPGLPYDCKTEAAKLPGT
jgi:class 3 adenylate cyclase/TolB-like protein